MSDPSLMIVPVSPPPRDQASRAPRSTPDPGLSCSHQIGPDARYQHTPGPNPHHRSDSIGGLRGLYPRARTRHQRRQPPQHRPPPRPTRPRRPPAARRRPRRPDLPTPPRSPTKPATKPTGSTTPPRTPTTPTASAPATSSGTRPTAAPASASSSAPTAARPPRPTATPSPSDPSTGSTSIPRRSSVVGGARLLLPVEAPTGVNASPPLAAKDSLFGTARQTLRARSTCTASRGAAHPSRRSSNTRPNRALEPRPARHHRRAQFGQRAQLGRSSNRELDPPFTPSFHGSNPIRAQLSESPQLFE